MKKYLIIISGLILSGQILWITVNNSLQVQNDPEVVLFPDFTLPSLFDPTEQIKRSDLKPKDIRIINFFASWCGPCKIEHPLLMDLTQKNISILGINYQDKQKSAKKFLKKNGNPYRLTVWDKAGKEGMSWGIMSIPQTFVINKEGHILYHRSGRLRPDDITKNILPLFQNPS